MLIIVAAESLSTIIRSSGNPSRQSGISRVHWRQQASTMEAVVDKFVLYTQPG